MYNKFWVNEAGDVNGQGPWVPKVYMQCCSITKENYSKLHINPEKPEQLLRQSEERKTGKWQSVSNKRWEGKQTKNTWHKRWQTYQENKTESILNIWNTWNL